MANHTLQNSGAAADEVVVLVILRAPEATPGARPHLQQALSDEQVAAALAVLSDAGFIEDYALTASGRTFLQNLSDP